MKVAALGILRTMTLFSVAAVVACSSGERADNLFTNVDEDALANASFLANDQLPYENAWDCSSDCNSGDDLANDQLPYENAQDCSSDCNSGDGLVNDQVGNLEERT